MTIFERGLLSKLAGLLCIGWLWFFFGNPAFLAVLIVPVLSAFILSVWKKAKAFDLFEPLVFSFVLALVAGSIAAEIYRFLFGLFFRGIVLAYPLFTVVPLLLLLISVWSVYGFVAFRELEQLFPEWSVSSFYLGHAVCLILVGGVLWALNNGLGVIG